MQEVTKIEKSLKKDLAKATDFECKTKADFEMGGSLLKTFKDAEKQAKALKDKALSPSLETTKQIREYFRPLENNLMACIRSVKNAMDGWYQQEQERIEAAKAKIQADSRIKSPGTLQRKLEELDGEQVGNTRKSRVVKVVDMALIPKEYFDLNVAKVRLDLLEGKDIPGVKLVNEVHIVAQRG